MKGMSINGIGISIEGTPPPFLATDKDASGSYGVENTATGVIERGYPTFKKAFQAAYRMNREAGWITDEDIAQAKEARRQAQELAEERKIIVANLVRKWREEAI